MKAITKSVFEPFATYDADVIFVAAESGLSADIPAIYAHLQERG